MIETNQDNADAIKAIELAKDLEALQNDERFKRVFLEEYINKTLRDESRNCISTSDVTRKVGFEKIQAVNYLIEFMETITNEADSYTEGL